MNVLLPAPKREVERREVERREVECWGFVVYLMVKFYR